MKKLFIIIAMLTIAMVANCQTFKSKSAAKKSVNVDTTTTFKWETRDTVYTVYCSPNNSYYIWRISGRTGLPYKQYMSKNVQAEMRAQDTKRRGSNK